MMKPRHDTPRQGLFLGQRPVEPLFYFLGTCPCPSGSLQLQPVASAYTKPLLVLTDEFSASGGARHVNAALTATSPDGGAESRRRPGLRERRMA